MKKFTLMLAGLGIAVSAVPVATAVAAPAPAAYQGWQNMNSRQGRIEAKINQGIRSGALTRREATGLRAKFREIVNLEAQFRRSRPGLTNGERRILDQRFDALERSIRIQKTDGQHRRY